MVRRVAAIDRRPVTDRAFHMRALAVVAAPRIHVRRLCLSGSVRRAVVDVLARVVWLSRLRPILRLRIAGGREYFENSITEFQNRNVERASAEIVDRNRSLLLFVEAVCQ